MKNFKLLTLFFTVIIAFACNSRKSTEEVEKLDSLHTEVVKTLHDFNKIDTASIHANYSELIENAEYIQKYNIDTLPLKMAQQISQYYTLRKKIQAFSDYAKIQEELLITQDQLENLKHDYLNNIIDEKKFREYLTVETNNFLVLETRINSMVNGWENFQELFPEYNSKVDSLVKSIKKRRNSLVL